MASTDLDRLFAPGAVAVVGASADRSSLRGRPSRYLRDHGYAGEVYPVNPSYDRIDGRPCYDGVADVPADVDLAVVLVPAAAVPDVVRECGEADVPFAVVIASGFAEVGGEGERLQAGLAAAADEGGVRVVGPNCVGLLSVPDRVTASFSSILERDDLVPGGLSVVAQSGGFAGTLFQFTQDVGVGTNHWVSSGNEADLTTVDFLDYFVDDPETDVAVTYVEALAGGERLVEIGKRAVETDTDIVAMHVGRSELGRAATDAHTGRVASEAAVYDGVFEQAGVTSVGSVDALVDTVVAASRVPSEDYPETGDGRGIGAVCVSGGAAALVADTADRIDLSLAELGADTREAVAEQIPPYGSARNPVDVTAAIIGDHAMFGRCLRLIADDDAVTGLLLQFGNSGAETVAAAEDVLFDLAADAGLPIATVFTGGRPDDAVRTELRERDVLYFEDPVRAVETFARLAERAGYRSRVPSVLAPDPGALRDRKPLPGNGGIEAALAGVGIGVDPTASTDADATITALDDPDFGPVLRCAPVSCDGVAYRGLPVTAAMAVRMIDESGVGRSLDGGHGALADLVAGVSDVYGTYALSELAVDVVVADGEATATDVHVQKGHA